MKSLKYAINEIYQNKFRILLLGLIMIISFFSIYAVFSIIEENFLKGQMPKLLQSNNLIQIYEKMNQTSNSPSVLNDPSNTEAINQKYEKLFSKISELDEYKNSLYFADNSSVMATTNKDVSTKKESSFGELIGSKLWEIKSKHISAAYLKEEKIEIKFIDGETLENFSDYKVLLPIEYEGKINLGTEIEFYTPFNNLSAEQMVEKHKYKVVGYIQNEQEIFNPTVLEKQKLENIMIFPEIQPNDVSLLNPEKNLLVNSVIAYRFFKVKDEELDSFTQKINVLQKESKINIQIQNLTFSFKKKVEAAKLVLISNIKSSIPVMIFYAIGIIYILQEIIKKRLKFLSVISMLGCDEWFIKRIYLIAFTLVLLASGCIYWYVTINYLKQPIDIMILIYCGIFIYLLTIVVMIRVLKIIKTANLSKLMKE
ncbi:MAG: hypothetical protein ACRCUP_05510 [Mycoplasmatales bacterium]